MRHDGSTRTAGLRVQGKVLCLDKDGLLFESAPFWSTLWCERRRNLQRYLSPAGMSVVEQLLGISGGCGTIDKNGPLALAYPRDEVAIVAAVVYQQTSQSWDAALEAVESAFSAADRTLNLQVALRPRPGFPDIVHRARQSGWKVAVVTSDQRDRTEESLDLFGVLPLIDFLCTPANVRHGKPFPDMLFHVAAHFDVLPRDLVMVGDSHVDMEMAQRAGATGVAILEGTTSESFQEYIVVDSLNDIDVRRK